MNQVMYQAKAACRVGGAYRKAGEIFPLPEFETTPSCLTKVGDDSSPAPSPSIAQQSAANKGVQGPAAPGRRRH
jgi:hypothetical protein